jgi:hypothetical protein
MVGLGGLEPPTSRLSGVRSNQLSYRPGFDLSKPNSKTSRVDPMQFKTASILKKEVIQPQVPLGLPCYDFTPITSHSLAACLRS